jgi:3-dehydroquinate synthase
MGGTVSDVTARIRVESARGAYHVVVNDDLSGFGGEVRGVLPRVARLLVVTDTNVAPLHADRLEAALLAQGFGVTRIVVEAGESHKTLATWAAVLDAALAAGIDRGQALVALGGGVVGDLAGFAAATLARGVPIVQVPTTLLAAVDASVGGKTAVDHPAGKNLIGAFHPPSLVWTATDHFATLPKDVLRDGWAEVVKHAALAGCLDAVTGWSSDPHGLTHAVLHSVGYKAEIVAQDERERGVRAWLNLGHTVAHGVEAAGGLQAWSHGEAVSVGLVAEARFAAAQGWASPSVAEALAATLQRLGLPTRLPVGLRAAALAAMGHDKKREGGTLRLPYLRELGDPALAVVSIDQLSAMWPEDG